MADERTKKLKGLWTDKMVQILLQFYSNNTILLSKSKADKLMVQECLESFEDELMNVFTGNKYKKKHVYN